MPTSNSTDFETSSDLCRQSTLSAAQRYIEKFLARWNGRDILPRRLHFGEYKRSTSKALLRRGIDVEEAGILPSAAQKLSRHSPPHKANLTEVREKLPHCLLIYLESFIPR